MDKILETIQGQTTLVGGALFSDELNRILVGLCDIVREQSETIQSIQRDLASRPTVDLIDSKVSQVQQELSDFKAKYNHQKAEESKSITSMHLEHSELMDKLQSTMKSNETLVSNFSGEVRKQLHDENLIFSTTSKNLVERVSDLKKENNQLNEKMNSITELLNQIGPNSILALSDRLKVLEEQSTQIIKDARDSQSELEKTRISVSRDFENFTKKIQTDLNNLQIRVQDLSIQTDAHDIEDTRPTGNGSSYCDADIQPLIRGIHRNSRRIDFFDQQVSSIRRECENLTDSMRNCQTYLEQFHHTIFDYGVSLQKLQDNSAEKFKVISENIGWVGNGFRTLWGAIIEVADAHKHLSSASSLTVDTISNTFSSITTRPLPVFNLLDETVVESTTVFEAATDRKVAMNVDEKIADFRQKLESGPSFDQNLPEQPKPYKETIKRFEGSPYILQQVDDAHLPVPKDESMILIAIEEMRLKGKELDKIMSEYVEKTSNKVDQLADSIKTKADSEQLDRVTTKIQQTLHKLQRNIDNVSLSQSNNSAAIAGPGIPMSRPTPATVSEVTGLHMETTDRRPMSSYVKSPFDKGMSRGISTAPKGRNSQRYIRKPPTKYDQMKLASSSVLSTPRQYEN